MTDPQVRFATDAPSDADRMTHLDLADHGNRMAASDVVAKLEQKRLEYERQRAKQQAAFEAQMRALQEQQAAEEAELLASSSSSSDSPEPNAIKKSSASAPATPPRSPSALGSSEDGDADPDAYARMTRSVADIGHQRANLSASPENDMEDHHGPAGLGIKTRSKSGNDLHGFNAMSPSVPSQAKFVTQTVPNTPIGQGNGSGSIGTIGSGVRKGANAGSKSVPGSRRPSESEADDHTAAPMHASMHLAEGLSRLNVNGTAAAPRKPPTSDAPILTSFLFDDEMENELNNPSMGGHYLAMNTDDDKFPILVRRDSFPGILSASSAALDLAPLSQTPPRSSGFLARGRNSEWPQFSGNGHASPNPANKTYNLQKGFDHLGSTASIHAPDRGPGSPSQSRTLPPPGSGRNSPVIELNSLNSPNKRAASHSGGVLGGPVAPGSPDEFRSGKRSSLVVPPAANSPFGSNVGGAFGMPYNQYANGSGSSSGGSQELYASEFGQLTGAYQSPQQSYGQKSYGNVRGLVAPGSVGLVGQKRMEDEGNRFVGLHLEDLQGDMANLCKDQHGCRFLQRKLEEGNPLYRDMIFAEVYPKFAELMVDSFGNYLAQRLLENSTDEQKDILLTTIHDQLINISLNIHGTRAIQRLIDHLTTPRQIQTFTSALNMHVVTLIKDLNGNHVIQKCLNSLKPEDNQFIYNAVANNCIEVATHRHGCCVMQRCIDHASESQRVQLVTEITYHCLTLVQDPFSNYVVQYCLEFDRRFVEAIIRQFHGNVCALSCHKFSSNVIEKCIRVADPEGRRVLIAEILERGRLERLVKDLYANYVVQTACDYAEPGQRDALVQQIRPLLPTIRNTPYGKRIAARIQKATPVGGQRFVSYPMSGGFSYPNQASLPYGQPPVLDPAFQQRTYSENAFYSHGQYGAPGFGSESHNHSQPPPQTYTPFL